MIKLNFYSKTVRIIAMACALQAPIFAADDQTADTVVAGARAPTQEEQAAAEQKRAEAELAEQQENSADEPETTITHDAIDKLNAIQAKVRGLNGVRSSYRVEVVLPSDYFYYSGYQHFAMFFSDSGRIMELEDGSQWEINYYDRYDTLNWLTGDRVVIYPNSEWLTKYNFPYCFVNCQTGVSVRSKLLSALVNGVYTKSVYGVDIYNGILYLSDGSMWEVKGADIDTLSKWFLGDITIVGCNDSWWSRDRWPAILINVNINQHIYVRLLATGS